MLDLVEELSRIVAALNDHELDYALCGGIAMAIYDRPRATVDIDLLIVADSLAKAIEIAKSLEYTVRGLDMTFANDAIEIKASFKDRRGNRNCPLVRFASCYARDSAHMGFAGASSLGRWGTVCRFTRGLDCSKEVRWQTTRSRRY